ncbi:MAG TPA: hypothetical protein ENN13_03175 [Candidatus Altiarchaeales archaeon]|nr:hypothetical protein [Candidatus Altiarchaeales archaeon]
MNVFSKLLPLIILVFLCGCICIPGTGGSPDDSGASGGSTSGGASNGVVSDGSSGGGILSGLNPFSGGGSGGSGICHIQPGAEKLTLTDCEKEKTTFNKETCKAGVAIVKNDISICKTIASEGIRGFCVSTIAQCRGDESLCNEAGSDVSLIYTCVSMVAEGKKDASICEGISNPVYKKPCIRQVAAVTGNLALCDRIDDGETEKDRCFEAVAIYRKDPSICEKVSGSIDYWRQECVMKVSMAAQDMTLCASLKTDSKSGKDNMIGCAENISASAGSASSCNVIKVEDIRDYHCITPIAVKSGEVKACEKITDNSRRIHCATQVALKLKDASVCEKITLPSSSGMDSYGKNNCIIDVVKTTKDKSACARITDNTNAKRSCEQA